jgi:hypothetical protein
MGQTPSLGQQVQTYAVNRVGQQVGSGECFDLADRALRAAGARSAADYGEVTADADYRWGDPVQLADLQPGDVLQFRDYEVTITVVVTRHKTFRDGSTEDSEDESTETYGRPHHTAIVSSRLGGGRLRVLEQNAPPRGGTTPQRVVRSNEIHTAGSTSTQSTVLQESDGVVQQETTTTITVTGTIWAYRPQAR